MGGMVCVWQCGKSCGGAVWQCVVVGRGGQCVWGVRGVGWRACAGQCVAVGRCGAQRAGCGLPAGHGAGVAGVLRVRACSARQVRPGAVGERRLMVCVRVEGKARARKVVSMP